MYTIKHTSFHFRTLYPVILLLVGTGCATTTKSTDDSSSIDNQLVLGVANSWLDRAISGDITAAMNLVDDSFASESFATKLDLTQFLFDSNERDFFTRSDVKIDKAMSTVRGDSASVQNIELHAAMGTVVAGFELDQTRKGWLITSLTWEMY
jgi:hypothetical protein